MLITSSYILKLTLDAHVMMIVINYKYCLFKTRVREQGGEVLLGKQRYGAEKVKTCLSQTGCHLVKHTTLHISSEFLTENCTAFYKNCQIIRNKHMIFCLDTIKKKYAQGFQEN